LEILTQSWESKEISKHDEAGTQRQAGKAKKLANMMKQALNGKAKKKWTEITNKRTAWNEANMQEKFYKMLQKLRRKFLEIGLTRSRSKQ
jgi:hypothetical protein